MAIKIIKKEGGFTLLELLIVIVIIAILALLILPNLTSAPKKARDTTRKTDVTAIRKALEEYFVSNNVYPGSTWKTDLQSGSAPLMKTVPSDPKPGWPDYTYTPGSGNTTYTVAACLENDGDKGSDTYATSQAGAPSGCTTRIFELVNAN